MLSIPAIMEQGRKHQLGLHRARAALYAITSRLRTASPEIRNLTFKLNENGVPEAYLAQVAWADYIIHLREDASTLAPE